MVQNPWRRPGRPLVIAHRGHCVEQPENTMPAYRRAVELGAEMIEADVQLTRDNQLIMLHDQTLDRTTSGTGRVCDATWAEIRALDAGAWRGAEFRGTRIPSTEAFLDFVGAAGLAVCLEVKAFDTEQAIATAEALADLLVRVRALEWAFIASYHHAALERVRRRVPNAWLAPERLPDDLPADPPEAVRQARALGAPVLQHRHDLITPDLVAALHATDVAVWAWTPNLESDISATIALGVDGVMSDDVATTRAAVDEQRRPSAP